MKISTQLSQILLFFLILTIVYTQVDPEQVDRQTQHIQQFARTMSDFIPTQTFTFTIGQGQQENFFLWPGPQIDKIRGVFYIDNSQDEEAGTGEGFFVGCEVNGVMKKPFVNERLGVFTLNMQTKPSNIKLIFKSDSRSLNVYLSYEMKESKQTPAPANTDQNVPTKQQEEIKQKKSKLKQVTQSFQKVRASIQGQQNALRMVLKTLGKHNKKFENQMKYANTRIAIETGIIILSGLLGMWIIKKQMANGYELLV